MRFLRENLRKVIQRIEINSIWAKRSNLYGKIALVMYSCRYSNFFYFCMCCCIGEGIDCPCYCFNIDILYYKKVVNKKQEDGSDR